VPLIADLTITEPPMVVCQNLSFFVDTFCSDVRASNPNTTINCTALSLNGVDCPDGVCPCNFTQSKRRLLQVGGASNGTNLSTLVVWAPPVNATPVEVVKPVIEVKQAWIAAIKVTEAPRPPTVSDAGSFPLMFVLIGAAAGGVVIVGLAVGLSVYFCIFAPQYQPIPTPPSVRVNRKLPKFIMELKIR